MMLAFTIFAVLRCRQFPWLLIGWLWFLGTLVPVIGLVQVGNQSMADRYTYIPFIGLFIMFAWSVDAWLKRQPSAGRIALPLSLTLLVAYALMARIQLTYWRNSIDVFSHSLMLTASNPFADNNLSYSLAQARRGPDAIPRLGTVLRKPGETKKLRKNLIYDTASVGLYDDAQIQLSEALNYDPGSALLHNNLGIVLIEQKKTDEAIEEFEKAIEIDPKSPWAYFNASIILKQKGRVAEAGTNYTKAVALRPALRSM
jgi:tetratricopeptide (TPR) repeat protein